MGRNLPNIAITGTPGTGKSTLSKRLATKLEGFEVLDVNVQAKEQGLYEERDEGREAWVIDTDKLYEKMSPSLSKGGRIVDWMHADFWEPDLIDLVITLRASNTTLFDRYKERKYPDGKVQENLDNEIMNEIGNANIDYFTIDEEDEDEEEQSGFTEVVELNGDTDAQMESNLSAVVEWVGKWKEAVQKNGKDGPPKVPLNVPAS